MKLGALLVVIGGFYIVILVLVALFQEKLLFHPNAQDFHSCREMKIFGSDSEVVSYQDQTLRFYISESVHTVGGQPTVVINFHGNANSACDRAFFVAGLNKSKAEKLTIVMSEYPGYSTGGDAPSDGPPTEKKILANALASFDYFAERFPEARIFLFGESLGTGPATYVASLRKVAGLILQSPYASISEVGQVHYPFLPIRLLIRHKFQADVWAKKVTAPVLAFHGTNDKVIPYKIGKKQITNFSKAELVTIEGAEHNNVTDFRPDLFWGKTKEFLSP